MAATWEGPGEQVLQRPREGGRKCLDRVVDQELGTLGLK